MTQPARRRIDRILNGSFLEGLREASTAELRGRLRQCRAVEDELSMQRRLLHGTLDILRAEVERRGTGDVAGSRILDRITAVLAREGAPPRRGSRPRLPAVGRAEARRHLDRILARANLARLPELSAAELESLAGLLEAEERELSARRKAVLDVVDALERELVRRYKEGTASPGEVLRPVGGGQKD